MDSSHIPTLAIWGAISLIAAQSIVISYLIVKIYKYKETIDRKRVEISLLSTYMKQLRAEKSVKKKGVPGQSKKRMTIREQNKRKALTHLSKFKRGRTAYQLADAANIKQGSIHRTMQYLLSEKKVTRQKSKHNNKEIIYTITEYGAKSIIDSQDNETKEGNLC